jgi:hypothetical protein
VNWFYPYERIGKEDFPTPRENQTTGLHRVFSNSGDPVDGTGDTTPPGPVLWGIHNTERSRSAIVSEWEIDENSQGTGDDGREISMANFRGLYRAIPYFRFFTFAG